VRVAPYGTWESPISPEMVTRAGIRWADAIEVDGDNVYWVESRPHEGGRNVIVRRAPGGSIEDVTPRGRNARTRVHEYGGGGYAVRDGIVYFADFDDQRLYRHAPGSDPEPITPEPALPAGDRYADITFGPDFLVCVRERHSEDGEPVNELVLLPLDGSAPPEVIASGHDFYASPRICRHSRRLAWLTWDHPNMPWNGTTLWVADLGADGKPGEPISVAGGPDESIFQPEWSPGCVLHFVSDRTGWWNLYRLENDAARAVHPLEADLGLPQWVFRMRRYAFLGDDTVVTAYNTPAGAHLCLHRPDGSNDTLRPPGSFIGSRMAAAGTDLYLVAGAPDRETAITRLDTITGEAEVIRAPEGLGVDPAYLSMPEHVVFATPDGDAHAYHYPPTNPDFTAPGGERPPLIVISHGGPTSATYAVLDPSVQFWTSRGFAVLDVDYGGSTGYGRAYRERLHGTWGIVDVRDCTLAALQVAEAGQADPERLAITGGSAGGFTTLGALTFRDDFAAGASHYGVADLELLAKHTHKFESRYLDWLVGPYPEAADAYRERSPIHHAECISCPVILFQGLEDRVVPPEQAEVMAAALRSNGVPVAHITYAGEGHGFRRAENMIRTLEAELSFYGQVFGFIPAGDLESVQIDGL